LKTALINVYDEITNIKLIKKGGKKE